MKEIQKKTKKNPSKISSKNLNKNPSKITSKKNTSLLPAIAVRDLIAFPETSANIYVGRKFSIEGLTHAVKNNDNLIVLLTQKQPHIEPNTKSFYDYATVGIIHNYVFLEDNTIKVVYKAINRIKINKIEFNGDFFEVDYKKVSIITNDIKNSKLEKEFFNDIHDKFVALKRITEENFSNKVFNEIKKINKLKDLIEFVAYNFNFSNDDKFEILKSSSLLKRVNLLMGFLEIKLEFLKLHQKIQIKTRNQIEKGQKDFFINEQIKQLQKEMSDDGDSFEDINDIEKLMQNKKIPTDVKTKLDKEFKKLKSMSTMSPEYSITKNYLDWLLSMPWGKYNKTQINLSKSKKTLDSKHYGLEKVKDSIIEYLAVIKRKQEVSKQPIGQILCFVGPPGVGKTSLAESISQSCNRELIRIPLGGVRDEAELRGHRRTYIGSMPGKIIQKISKAKSMNPIILFDEIDKIGKDFRGDPESALLEILDPEQNKYFNDHFLEVNFDLSQILFICTANSTDFSVALHDRLEVIYLEGYTDGEKYQIAKHYILKKLAGKNNLEKGEVNFNDGSIREAIKYYGKEAGVRTLERNLNKVIRKVIKQKLENNQPNNQKVKITKENLKDYLGIRKYHSEYKNVQGEIGEVIGLAWNSVGGDILKIQVKALKGREKKIITGNLGKIMEESIQIAYTVVKDYVSKYYPTISMEKLDYHIHVPSGATPKDGPSAGLAIANAFLSAVTEQNIKPNFAITGELSLIGKAYPIGGLQEKLLAAKRAHIDNIIIPEENKANLAEVSEEVKKDLNINFVNRIEEVFDLLIEKPENSPKFSKALKTKHYLNFTNDLSQSITFH